MLTALRPAFPQLVVTDKGHKSHSKSTTVIDFWTQQPSTDEVKQPTNVTRGQARRPSPSQLDNGTGDADNCGADNDDTLARPIATKRGKGKGMGTSGAAYHDAAGMARRHCVDSDGIHWHWFRSGTLKYTFSEVETDSCLAKATLFAFEDLLSALNSAM